MREKARQHLRPLLKQYLEAEDIETSAVSLLRKSRADQCGQYLALLQL